MISSDVSDAASEELARRLQEEEDQRAAFQLQHQLDRSPGLLRIFPRPVISTTTARVSHHIAAGPGPQQYYVASDDEADNDDVRELSFVQLSDDDISDRVIPMSPETDQLVSSAFNTAFTDRPGPASQTGPVNQTDDDVVILDDSAVEDLRPPRQNRQPSSEDVSDNIVLTVGRSTRSQTRAASINDSSIVITNNSQAPSANTRSRTRSNQNRGGNTNSRSRDNSPATTSSGDTSTVQIIDHTRTPTHILAANATRMGRATYNRRGQSSSNSNNRNNNSDNQPSTSSGRSRNNNPGRPRRGGAQVSSRGSTQGQNISSRVILHGVPIMGSQMSNGVPDLIMQRLGRNFTGPTWYARNGMPVGDGFNNVGVNLIFGPGADHMTYEQMLALDDDISLEPGQGLSKHDISQYTLTQSYKNSDNSEENKSSCSICMSEFDDGEKIRTLPCFHSFHTSCIDNWLNRKAECPVCRSSVGPETLDLDNMGD